ncbi:nuclear transport factor 2 family protein [Rhodoferax sp.]|uniref:nuclear transport factor 2 family protein n=1 Tax=Rhodoferax sp. TaxID=50421 RepID=UPI002ACE0100|nr:nuclear transport factor 2 family protein [Rhodoferax sp.]MDZ7921185.1 nuclear transport factor 2 family protein [Rhodoferax sp.]
MSTLETVAAEAACRALVLQGADAVDRGDAQGFAALFVPDGTLVRPDGSLLQGREAIAKAYAGRDPDRLTQHLVCNQQVSVDLQAGTAEARSKVLLWTGRHSSPSTPQGRPADATSQVGEFVDELEHTPEGWRIRSRRAQFILYRNGAS